MTYNWSVAQYGMATGEWDWNKMVNFPMELRQKIATMKAPQPNGHQDVDVWGLTANGKFSMLSAYESLTSSMDDINCDWKLMWRWSGPQRVRSFLWLAYNGALLTNTRRNRLGIIEDPSCVRCSASMETVLHVLRDCNLMQGGCLETIDFAKVLGLQFFSLGLQDWMHFAMSTSLGREDVTEWKLIYGIAVWMAWKWRNSFIFNGENNRQEAPLYAISQFAKEVGIANKFRACMLNIRGLDRSQIIWRPPAENWVKLNTDGAFRRSTNMASAGGLIRDHHGRWLYGFMRRIGSCSIEKAELWAVVDGLKMAWDFGFKRVEVELDAQFIVENLLLIAPNSGNQTWDN